MESIESLNEALKQAKFREKSAKAWLNIAAHELDSLRLEIQELRSEIDRLNLRNSKSQTQQEIALKEKLNKTNKENQRLKRLLSVAFKAQGETYKNIAELLGLSPARVSQLFARGRSEIIKGVSWLPGESTTNDELSQS